MPGLLLAYARGELSLLKFRRAAMRLLGEDGWYRDWPAIAHDLQRLRPA